MTFFLQSERGLNLSFLLGDANIVGNQTDFLDLSNTDNRGHAFFEVLDDQLLAILVIFYNVTCKTLI